MKNILCASVIVFFVNFSFAQQKLINNDIDEITNSLINENNSLEDKLKSLERISKNDSSYCSVLTSKSYYLLQLEKLDDVIKIADSSLNVCTEYKDYFYINKAAAYIGKEEYDKALSTVKEGLKLFPKSFKLLQNKAIIYEELGKLEEAILGYKEVILVNPLYPKPHLQLGNICFKQKKMAQALMCFNMYLLLNPDSEESLGVLKSLNAIASAENENEPINLKISSDDALFEDLDLLLNQKVAINDKYKTGNKIKAALVNQNHLLLAQLKDLEQGSDFWSTKYVTFYNWITENDLFNDFIYTLFYSIEDKEYQKIIKNNQESIELFYVNYRDKWAEIVGKNGNKVSYYRDSNLQAEGEVDGEKPVNSWHIFNDDGSVRADGEFINGEREGKWVFYYGENRVKEIALYKQGKLNGEYVFNYKNGKQKIACVYASDSLNGEYKYYNDKGALIHKKYFKNGKLEGDYKSYFNVGEDMLEFLVPYSNDLVNGIAYEYHLNGNVYSEMNYSEGKKNGVEKKYTPDNKLYSEINFVDGKRQGAYKIFHINGKIKEEGTAIDNVFQGEIKQYYFDGVLQSDFHYVDGELNGVYTHYDYDGKIHYQYTYRKGEIVAYKSYNKNGEVIKEDRKRGGKFYYYGYSTTGNIISEGLYNIKGGKEGKWKFYNRNGILNQEGNYIDNKAEGEFINYYLDGTIESKKTYKEDVLNGYSVDYYKNSQMKNQGYYKEGNEQGEWRLYNIDGSLKSKYYYHKGNFNGEQIEYYLNNKIEKIYNYEFGQLIADKTYNENEVLHETVNFKKEEKEFTVTYKHFNGKPSSQITYKNGLKHGKYIAYYFDGKKHLEGEYANNLKNGEWIWYHKNGQIESKINYYYGQLHGPRADFYEDGTQSEEANYRYDDISGLRTLYHNNGNKNSTTQYLNGELHGRKEFYSVDGQLQLIRFYDHGTLLGYSYLDKESNEVPMIELENETGVVKAYFNNGNVSRELEYKSGNLVNNYNSYYYSGKIENSMSYKNDEYNGKDIEYYENGNKKREVDYVYGIKTGKIIEYYENGKMKKEIAYLNNEPQGEAKYYSSDGTLTKTEKYFNGNIFSLNTK